MCSRLLEPPVVHAGLSSLAACDTGGSGIVIHGTVMHIPLVVEAVRQRDMNYGPVMNVLT